MRPVRRGPSPEAHDYDDYKDAKPDLISRLGSYCSYCERHISTMLAVEHIQAKNLPSYQHLIDRWDNFLLACVNCNSTKKDKDVQLERTLLPDRDNTFSAFVYAKDGTVSPSSELDPNLHELAQQTLALTGLDKKTYDMFDENAKRIALDRNSQRMEIWLIAEIARNDVLENPDNEAVKRGVVQTALGYGFFSIWMAVFKNDVDMRSRLIDAFPGTRESGCFNPKTSIPVSPAPNPDKLTFGGKL